MVGHICWTIANTWILHWSEWCWRNRWWRMILRMIFYINCLTMLMTSSDVYCDCQPKILSCQCVLYHCLILLVANSLSLLILPIVVCNKCDCLSNHVVFFVSISCIEFITFTPHWQSNACKVTVNEEASPLSTCTPSLTPQCSPFESQCCPSVDAPHHSITLNDPIYWCPT